MDLPSFEESKRETEKRLKILEVLRGKLEPWTEALILVGSMAYGQNFSVRKESDIDLIILINPEKSKDIPNLFSMTPQIREALSLFDKKVIQHFTIIQKIEGVEVQFHFWNKKAHFKAEKLEKPWPKVYDIWVKDKHYSKGVNFIGEEKNILIDNVKKYIYGDVYQFPAYFEADGEFIQGILISNFLSTPKIIYTKDDQIYENLDILLKKVLDKYISEKKKTNFIDSLYGNWNFSPNTKNKIQEQISKYLNE